LAATRSKSLQSPPFQTLTLPPSLPVPEISVPLHSEPDPCSVKVCFVSDSAPLIDIHFQCTPELLAGSVEVQRGSQIKNKVVQKDSFLKGEGTPNAGLNGHGGSDNDKSSESLHEVVLFRDSVGQKIFAGLHVCFAPDVRNNRETIKKLRVSKGSRHNQA
jgi:hypothetical protein